MDAQMIRKIVSRTWARNVDYILEQTNQYTLLHGPTTPTSYLILHDFCITQICRSKVSICMKEKSEYRSLSLQIP